MLLSIYLASCSAIGSFITFKAIESGTFDQEVDRFIDMMDLSNPQFVKSVFLIASFATNTLLAPLALLYIAFQALKTYLS